MRKIIQFFIKYRKVTISTIFTEPVYGYEITVLSFLKFKSIIKS